MYDAGRTDHLIVDADAESVDGYYRIWINYTAAMPRRYLTSIRSSSMNGWKQIMTKYTPQVERWGLFEVSVTGPRDLNPFIDYPLKGVFVGKNEEKSAAGFYDGAGIYKVRFMPAFEGEYQFTIQADFLAAAETGTFIVTEAGMQNHGPVHVVNDCHLAYADGTAYYSIGTTCYVWELQSKVMRLSQRL